jgi:hypothetical protein
MSFSTTSSIGSSDASGKVKMKRVPSPRPLSTQMRPLWASTMFWEMERPRPEPETAPRARLACSNLSKMRSWSCSSISSPSL